MFERGAAAGLNHLLAQQPWAAERLKAFAGQCVEFRCPPFPNLRLAILDTGFTAQAHADAESALVVKLEPAALPLLIARDEGALKEVAIEGSAELASAVQYLSRHLRNCPVTWARSPTIAVSSSQAFRPGSTSRLSLSKPGAIF